MWKKVFQYFLRRFQITQGRSPMTAAEMNQIQSEAVNWINKTGGKTLPGTPQSQKPPFQGFTPRVIEGGKGKAGIGTLLKDSPEAIAKIKAENKAAVERLKAKKKTVEDFRDEGDWDPSGMASGGIAGPLHLYDGGRAKFDKGGMDRRGFLKLIAGLSALPVVGKFFKLAKPASKAAAPAAEVITRGTGGIPDYAWDLINVVKAKGTKEIMEGVSKRFPVQKKYTYKGVEVTEDGLGTTSVKKQHEGFGVDEAGEGYEGISKEVGFEIKKGETVVSKTGKPIQTSDEYFEATVRPDDEGKMKDVIEGIDDADHLDLKAIADESLIKKAEGGRVSLSKGGLAHVLGV